MGMETVESKKAEFDQNLELQVSDVNKSAPVDKLVEQNGDVDIVEKIKPPINVVDEWPAPKKISSFYFVKYRHFEDPNLKKKIDIADKEIQKRTQARSEIAETLRAKRSARAVIIDRLKPLNDENKRYRDIMGDKKKEREPLKASLDEIHNAISTGKSVFSSKEELDDLIKSLKYRLNHESIPLDEEKQLIKEIKVLEGARGKMITNAPMIAKQEAIKDKVKLIGADMDGVRKEQQEVWTKIVRLQEEMKPINEEITALEEELKSTTEKRDKAFESLLELKKARDEGSSPFYKNRSLLNSARDLSAKKNISTLEELCNTEVEAFMSKWSNSKAIREDYEKRILSSLDTRQLSRDGRMRNPDEKPILVQASQGSEADAAPIKSNIKQLKGDIKPVAEPVFVSVNKAENAKVVSESPVEKKEKVIATEEAFTEKPSEVLSKPRERDAAQLKEVTRQEEIAKAKMARERKQRLAEKAAAKAEVRAQKDAEKKLKDKEKRAKKKAGALLLEASDEPEVVDTNAVKVDASIADDINVPDPVKPEELKENLRYRNVVKSKNQISKVILKRKKMQSYWYWAIAGTSVAVLLLVALGWYIFAGN